MRFRHIRTGKIIDVLDMDARQYRNDRYEEIGGRILLPAEVDAIVDVPDGTVAEILKWAGADKDRRASALIAERLGKNRKGIIEALD